MLKELRVKAVKEFHWYIHNVCTNRAKATEHAQEIYDHALYSGYITEQEHKKLCLELPFLTWCK